MARKKQEEAPKGAPAWMATFSDLMNLLLCFFVLLFSMASVDAAKFELVVNSLRSAFSVLPTGGDTISEGQLIGGGLMALPSYANNFGDTLNDTEGNEVEDGTNTTVQEGGGSANDQDTQQGPGLDDASDSQDQQQQDVQPDQQAPMDEGSNTSQNQQQDQQGAEVTTSQAQEVIEEEALEESRKMAENILAMTTQYGIQEYVQVDFNGQFVRLTLNGALLFDSGSSDIKQQAFRVVDNIGKILDQYQESMIEVEGHTDNVPIRSQRFESNNVLSMYRALSVADRLRNASTVSPGNIVSAGRGDYAPIADNSTAEGRARNRRVEIKIFNSFNSKLANG